MNIYNPLYPPGIFGTDGNVWLMKLLEIGPWDMNTILFKQVTHGLPAGGWLDCQILHIDITTDDGLIHRPLMRFENGADPRLIAGGVDYINSTFIQLRCRTGSQFNTDINYNDGVINRGHIGLLYHE